MRRAARHLVSQDRSFESEQWSLVESTWRHGCHNSAQTKISTGCKTGGEINHPSPIFRIFKMPHLTSHYHNTTLHNCIFRHTCNSSLCSVNVVEGASP